MAEFSQQEIKSLAEVEIAPCVSIYMPIVAAERNQNVKRYHSLMDRTHQALLAAGVEHREADTMLAPARALADDTDFWATPREGLALFFSLWPESFRWYEDNSAAVQLTERIVVADHFYLTPLLPLLTGDGQFYILTVSQKHATLLRATRDTVRPMEVPGLPGSLGEAIGDEESGAQVQGRPTNKGGGEPTGVFGGDDARTDDLNRIMRFLQAVENAVKTAIGATNAPLVIAGLDQMLGYYRQVNSYPHLVEEGIAENPDGLQQKALHEMAWPLVEPIFSKKRNEAMEKFAISQNTPITSSVLADVIAAAYYGRVESLFVADAQPQYGRFNPQTSVLEVHKEARPDNADLYDLAAVQTVMNGGRVFVMPPEELPAHPQHHSTILAVFRY